MENTISSDVISTCLLRNFKKSNWRNTGVWLTPQLYLLVALACTLHSSHFHLIASKLVWHEFFRFLTPAETTKRNICTLEDFNCRSLLKQYIYLECNWNRIYAHSHSKRCDESLAVPPLCVVEIDWAPLQQPCSSALTKWCERSFGPTSSSPSSKLPRSPFPAFSTVLIWFNQKEVLFLW